MSQEPDVEGHVLDPDGSEDSADRDADGPALTHLPPTDDGGDDDTEGNIAY